MTIIAIVAIVAEIVVINIKIIITKLRNKTHGIGARRENNQYY